MWRPITRADQVVGAIERAVFDFKKTYDLSHSLTPNEIAKDVAAFASGGEGVPWSSRKDRQHGSTRIVRLCTVQEIESWWGATRHDGTLIEFRIVANGFLPRMVRGIVGTLVEIGRGARQPDLVDELFVARDRRKAPKNVSAEGLTLWAVGYGNEQPEAVRNRPNGRQRAGESG